MRKMNTKQDIIFDMETGDPDDFLTLALLAGHPKVNLKAVTVTPGTPHQIGVVRYCLDRLNHPDIPIGAFDINHMKARGTKDEHYVPCVSQWHYQTFGDIPPSHEAGEGWRVLLDNLGPDTTLVTGGPLKNTGRLVTELDAVLGEQKTSNLPPRIGDGHDCGQIVIQGGFAGYNVVPRSLPKFNGYLTCPTYNLNGDPKAAMRTLRSRHFRQGCVPIMVSKNVCHGVVYDKTMHERLKAVANPHPGLQLVMEGMEAYLRKMPKGKKFHDPLAAMCALDPTIGRWARAVPYRTHGQWGVLTEREFYDEKHPGENILGSFGNSAVDIITSYDHDKFIETMIGV